MNNKTFNKFFSSYAQNVDNVDEASAFWRLSDSLILELLKRHILKKATSKSVILDAGGGTGRWVVKMSEYTESSFAIYDRSKDMLDKASKNIESANISSRVTLTNGDMTDMSVIDSSSIDHIVSIYSPISFIYEPKKALTELYRVLKPGGAIMIMSHGYYNALASKINNYWASQEELLKLFNDKRVSWDKHVPELLTNSKESMESMLSDAGFTVEKTFGVPVLVQPGPEDFSQTNKGESNISKYLNNPEVFGSVFNIEMEINGLNTVSNRGMNIFTLAIKK